MKQYTKNQCTAIITQLAKKLGYEQAGGEFGHSFYKVASGRKYRMSDHNSIQKWVDVYGLADEEIRIHCYMDNCEIDAILKENGTNAEFLLLLEEKDANEEYYRNIELQQSLMYSF